VIITRIIEEEQSVCINAAFATNLLRVQQLPAQRRFLSLQFVNAFPRFRFELSTCFEC